MKEYVLGMEGMVFTFGNILHLIFYYFQSKKSISGGAVVHNHTFFVSDLASTTPVRLQVVPASLAQLVAWFVS